MKSLSKYIRNLKSFFLFGILFISFFTNAQENCSIYYRLLPDTTVYQNDDTIVCYNQKVTMVTEDVPGLFYLWEPGDVIDPYIKDVNITDSVKYHLTVYNSDSSFFCTDSLTFHVFPKINVAFEQITKGCPGECKAQVRATASAGNPPYRYLWSASMATYDSALALGLCTDESTRILVYDTVCVLDTAFLAKGYNMPEIEVTMSPDSLFSTNPQAQFSFDNKSNDSIPLSNWTWIFPDSSSTNQLTPKYVFIESDSVLFTYQTIDGCVDTITINVNVQDFDLTLYNVFTPNGDGINDTYEIPNLDRYISNQFIVFNRWGERVFEAKNYHNEWDGGNLPDGVYFYILKCQGYWEESVFHGTVSIYGSGN